MHLLPLGSIDRSHFYISGNVTVDPSAVIAPGVLLQADPGCHLVVAAGVCIGMGSLLHACRGRLELEAGATLGSGVLLIGSGKIGANACIGSQTTILDSSIAPGQSVPPGSLVGDRSRQIAIADATVVMKDAAVAPSVGQTDGVAASGSIPKPTPELIPESIPESIPEPTPESTEPNSSAAAHQSSSEATEQDHPQGQSQGQPQVYGQAYLERIMITLFPHRQSLDSSNGQSPPEEP
jgi:carbon dioxide concentrating mechanism protein CcmN